MQRKRIRLGAKNGLGLEYLDTDNYSPEHWFFQATKVLC